jgi:hypothetical protein
LRIAANEGNGMITAQHDCRAECRLQVGLSDQTNQRSCGESETRARLLDPERAPYR